MELTSFFILAFLSTKQNNLIVSRKKVSQEFKQATVELLRTVDLRKKQKDFEHLLFNKANSEKILHFGAFIDLLTE